MMIPLYFEVETSENRYDDAEIPDAEPIIRRVRNNRELQELLQEVVDKAIEFYYPEAIIEPN